MKTINEKIISQAKYNHLTRFKNLMPEDIKQIESYENSIQGKIQSNKKTKEYFSKVRTNEVRQQIQYLTLTKQQLWEKFLKIFFLNEKKIFIKDKFSIQNIKPLFYYFLYDFENFKKCNQVSNLTKPNLNKGLFIIGNYGCGKSSIMLALEKATLGTALTFKSYTTNDVVTRYESCENPSQKNELIKELTTGVRYFDDVLSERQTNNFGKIDLFREIFEKRYNESKRTFITINYDPDYPNDAKKAIELFGKRYGSRVYDRLFEMFNIITFTGGSRRQ
jgi:DNA replication protein DnaC